jgi:hypothetical protein
VWKKNRGRKSAVGKSWQEKCSMKGVVEKRQQKKCSKKTAAEKSWQQNTTRKKMYGFHMCSVELMNLVEGFLYKPIGCPLGSLRLVVEWF